MHVEICDSTMSPRTTTIFGPPHTGGETMIVVWCVCLLFSVLQFDDDAVCEITDDGVSSLGVAKEGKPCSLALQDVWSSVIR